MMYLLAGFKKAFLLLLGMNSEIAEIIRLSLFVSLAATCIAIIIGLPAGSIVALTNFRLKKVIIAFINTLMGLPPVVVGLMISLLLFRNGPLGFLGWLYTPAGMIVAQVIIATPIITGLCMAAVQNVDPKFYQQVLALGANRVQAVVIVFKEIKFSLLAAVVAGFGSVISEVGAVMMVGGNIKGQTRVLTTATVLETHMGNFDMAIALGLILFLMSFIINSALTLIQQKKLK